MTSQLSKRLPVLAAAVALSASKLDVTFGANGLVTDTYAERDD